MADPLGHDEIRILLQQCLENDRQAQERLYRSYFHQLFPMCKRHAPDEDIALMMLNDGFLRAFTKLDTFGFQGSFEGWLRRIVWHAISNYYKKHEKYVK